MIKHTIPAIIGATVIVKIGHPIWTWENDEPQMKDIRPDLVGKEAIILYSYNQVYEYGRDIGDKNDSFSLKFLDGNVISWYIKGQFDIKSLNY